MEEEAKKNGAYIVSACVCDFVCTHILAKRFKSKNISSFHNSKRLLNMLLFISYFHSSVCRPHSTAFILQTWWRISKKKEKKNTFPTGMHLNQNYKDIRDCNQHFKTHPGRKHINIIENYFIWINVAVSVCFYFSIVEHNLNIYFWTKFCKKKQKQNSDKIYELQYM